MVTYLQELYLSIAKRVSVYDYNISIYSLGEHGNETKSVIDIDQCCVIGRSHNSKSSRFVRVEMREEEGSVSSRNVPIQSFVNSEYISPYSLGLRECSATKFSDSSDSSGNVPGCTDNNNSNNGNNSNNNDNSSNSNNNSNCDYIHVNNNEIESNCKSFINSNNLVDEKKIKNTSELNSINNKIEIEIGNESTKKNILYTESDSNPLYLENCISHLTYRIPLGRSISEGKVTVNVR